MVPEPARFPRLHDSAVRALKSHRAQVHHIDDLGFDARDRRRADALGFVFLQWIPYNVRPPFDS